MNRNIGDIIARVAMMSPREAAEMVASGDRDFWLVLANSEIESAILLAGVAAHTPEADQDQYSRIIRHMLLAASDIVDMSPLSVEDIEKMFLARGVQYGAKMFSVLHAQKQKQQEQKEENNGTAHV